MEKGVVKWFVHSKGCGFITNSEGRDVFVYFTVIESS